MSFENRVITEDGTKLILKTLAGEPMTFTRIALGNGTNEVLPRKMTALQNEVIDATLTKCETGIGCVTLSFKFDNSGVEDGFYLREAGIFAKDAEENEYLYAYLNTATPEFIPPNTDDYITSLEEEIIIAVGDAEKVTAIISEFGGYATKEELNAHLTAKNPHNITKEDVGLDKIENEEFDNQRSFFNPTKNLELLTSGSTLGSLMGKLATAIQRLRYHIIDDVGSHVAPDDRVKWNEKADLKHEHSAKDITSGILSVARGGTGCTTARQFLQYANYNFGIFASDVQAGNFSITLDNGFYIEARKVTIHAEAGTVTSTPFQYSQKLVADPVIVANLHAQSADDYNITVADAGTTGANIYVYNAKTTTKDLPASIILIGRQK